MAIWIEKTFKRTVLFIGSRLKLHFPCGTTLVFHVSIETVRQIIASFGRTVQQICNLISDNNNAGASSTWTCHTLVYFIHIEIAIMRWWFPKSRGCPQFASIFFWIFQEISHPAIGVPPWLWKPPCEHYGTYGMISYFDGNIWDKESFLNKIWNHMRSYGDE